MKNHKTDIAAANNHFPSSNLFYYFSIKNSLFSRNIIRVTDGSSKFLVERLFGLASSHKPTDISVNHLIKEGKATNPTTARWNK